MRLSPNPVVSGAAWTYIWFFRAIPRIVLLFFCANLGALYATYDLGFPFDRQLMDLFGFSGDLRFLGLDGNQIFAGFTAGLLGLALSEGAYMAEIVRAGIQSVDPGQTEAASALGQKRTEFMLDTLSTKASEVLADRTRFQLDTRQLAAFNRLLDEPIDDKAIRMLLRKAPWER